MVGSDWPWLVLPFRQRAGQDSERRQHGYHQQRDSKGDVYHSQVAQRELVERFVAMIVRCVHDEFVRRPHDVEYPVISCNGKKNDRVDGGSRQVFENAGNA